MKASLDLDLLSRKLLVLPLTELMGLRLIVNEEIAAREIDALAALKQNIPYEGYAMSKPKASRVINDSTAYEKIVRERMGDAGFVTSILPLTKVEDFVKKQFDEDDASGILAELAKTYGTKLSSPSLIYVGVKS